jgi:hypothetical protein
MFARRKARFVMGIAALKIELVHTTPKLPMLGRGRDARKGRFTVCMGSVSTTIALERQRVSSVTLMACVTRDFTATQPLQTLYVSRRSSLKKKTHAFETQCA